MEWPPLSHLDPDYPYCSAEPTTSYFIHLFRTVLCQTPRKYNLICRSYRRQRTDTDSLSVS